MHYKDAVLDQLAEKANVAQFISFDPTLKQRFSRVMGLSANHQFTDLRDAAVTLLGTSTERSVNVRSFDPASPKSKEFVYGVTDAETLVAHVTRLAGEGLHTILNETVDVNDGGVSGVMLGGVIEFAPGDTPRCVEKPGTVSLSAQQGFNILQLVYGFEPDITTFPATTRVEFSIHPLRRGVHHTHTLVWELEEVEVSATSLAIPQVAWPNKFSALIGDKTFGLLIATLNWANVPRTIVIGRHVAPFRFGTSTKNSSNNHEKWLRTCPTVQTPGKFTTVRGWTDPYALMQREDPTGTDIAAVLCQDGVNALYSGAAVMGGDGKLIVEGVKGFGDKFMVGADKPTPLPPQVVKDVESVYTYLSHNLGPVRLEWVDDGSTIWVVQLHKGASVSSGSYIVPGVPTSEIRFDVTEGLEKLRQVIAQLPNTATGIVLVGDVGVTSHFGDVLRKAAVISRVERV